MSKVFDGKSIVNRNKIYEVPEGTVILQEGEVNLDMYKLLEGHIEMYTGYGTENEALIGILGPGACFGEFGLLTMQPAIYTIIAYSNVKLLRIPSDFASEFVSENAEDVIQIMKNMANNMMKMQKQFVQMSQELSEVRDDPDKKVVIIKENIKEYAVYANNAKGKYKITGEMRYLTKEKEEE